MEENKRFKEHHLIDQYLKKRSLKVIKSRTVSKHTNQLSNFPIGLIIITKESLNENKLEFINMYACKLFQVKENVEINTLKKRFSEYVKLKNNCTTKTPQSLNDIIFNMNSYDLETDNFIPFESMHSKASILYIKINDIEGEKYIVIDKYDKYLEERKYIELNLIKNINYQYLHTLYHELNNPLNALLALSGEGQKFDQTEICGTRIYDKNSILQKKSFNKKGKKERKARMLSLDSSHIKTFIPDLRDETKSRKKSIDGNIGLNNRISLLVNIIKIFIKNFILYLKIRADNLLSLKNEFDLENDMSDIMNAVELSEYERELSKHKLVKINLQYILELYLKKYQCLFKYKEIEYDTYFEKLRNIFILTDEFNFSYYIRQIYTYLYYVVPKKDGFSFEYLFENDKLKIMIKKKSFENLTRRTDFYNNHRISFKEEVFKIEQAIQTKEMTKEVLYAMTKKLKFSLEIFDCENSEQNYYLFITIPFEKIDESEDNDDLKDEEINEMVVKDAIYLEEKLKRHFPSNSHIDGEKSNVSTIQIVETLNKSGEDMKFSVDSYFSVNKTNINNAINSSNYNVKGRNSAYYPQKNHSLNNLYLNDYQKKLNGIKNTSNNFLLNKYKDNESKNFEKSKFKINSFSEKIILLNKNINGNGIRNASPEIKKESSEKEKKEKDKKDNESIKKNLIKNQKIITNEIFSLIHNTVNSKDINKIEKQVSEKSINLLKNKKDEMTFKEPSAYVSGYASSIKVKANENKPLNNQLNNDNIYSTAQNSTSVITSFLGKIKQPKMKSSYLLSGSNADNENKNLERNGIILIELEKDKKVIINNTNILYKPNLCIIEEENNKKLKSCDKIYDINNYNYISDSDNKKNIYNSTLVGNDIDENETLFMKAVKESQFHMEKKKNKKKTLLLSRSSAEKSKKKYGSESDSEFFNSEEQCNCADILVVDDEEFNVMATRRMLKNLGLESDAAYNGEECISLINEKIKLNCKCKSSYYKLIFLDIVMPVMDGIETAKNIQEMIDKKVLNDDTKIIFISGNIDGSNLQKLLLEINCVKECLQKPVKISKYQKIIEKYYNVI